VGSTLQDDIAASTRSLLIKGHDILGMVPGMNFVRLLHEKACPQSGATPESPVQVSWIGHRLVRDNYFLRCDHSSWALYLFLTSVADADGLAGCIRRIHNRQRFKSWDWQC